MKEVIALVLQTWFDIAILYSGSADNAFAIAQFNGQSITDDVIAGQTVIIPSATDLDYQNTTVDYFTTKQIIPATGITDTAINEVETAGIGAMIIETNFIVR